MVDPGIKLRQMSKKGFLLLKLVTCGTATSVMVVGGGGGGGVFYTSNDVL